MENKSANAKGISAVAVVAAAAAIVVASTVAATVALGGMRD